MTRSSRRKASSPPRSKAGEALAGDRARGAATTAPGKPRAAPRWAAWLDSRPVRLAALPLALLIAANVHGHAIGTFFAQDDIEFIARARGLAHTPWSLARPLSEGWTWRLLVALFGLNPLPYHVFNFALHLANTTLVFAIARRLLRSHVAAFAAAVLFGASAVAFTPLHWVSCLVELMAAFFSLAAFLLWWIGRERGSTPLLWLGAVAGLAALLSKESAILFPLALIVAHFRGKDPPAGARTLIPPLAATVAYAIGFVATLRLVHYIHSEAYAMTAWPIFVAQNAATYLKWIAAPHVAVRDAVAAMDPSATRAGLLVAAVLIAILWTQRRADRHPEEVGAAWFAALLLPVVPLEHHTYLYYLYLPLPGLCWLVAAAGQRAIGWLEARVPAAAPVAAAAAAVTILGLVALDFTGVRRREAATRGDLPLDKTMREALLLRNVLTDLRGAGLEPGMKIAFVNPAPIRHVSLVDTTSVDPSRIGSYLPLEGVMRGGQVIALFHPGVRYLGFARELPREWEDAEVFLFQDEGHVRHLGRGGKALAELGYFLLPVHDWARAEAMLLRSRQLGDTLADATFGLIITRDFLGDPEGSRRYVAEFLRRWPDDPRAKAIPVAAR